MSTINKAAVLNPFTDPTGTAASADKLYVARKIQGVAFDGTQDISLPTFTTQTDGLVPKRVGATTTKYLREDGTWVVPTDTTYALLTKASAEAGTATSANSISAKVLKEAIQYHAPTVTNIVGNAATATKLATPVQINGVDFDGSQSINIVAPGGGGGGMNFAAKVEIELEIVIDFAYGEYHITRNILSVSNQANIASTVMDSNGILCLTFNTPISNPNLIATTKGEIKHVTHEGENYKYLTTVQSGNFNTPAYSSAIYSIFQDAEKGYVNTNTKLYISCNLVLYSNYAGDYTLYSAFPARFNLGIIDA